MLLKLIVQFIKPHWPLVLAVVLLQLASTIASLYLPALNAQIIDDGVATGDTGMILRLGSLMLGITVLQVVTAIAAVYFGAKAAMRFGRDVRGAIFHRVGEFSEREVSRFGAPSLITRSTNDVQQVQMLVLMTFTLLVGAPILAIGGVIAALSLDVQLSWLIAVAVPVLLVAIGLVIVRLVPLFRQMQERIDTVNRVLREQLQGIRVVRAFVRERVETDRFAKANTDLTDTALKAGRLFALMFPIVMFVMNVSSVAVIWFGAFRVEDGSIEIGTLIAFLSYLIQILMAVMMATFMAVMIPRAAVCADRISEVLADRVERRAAEEPGHRAAAARHDRPRGRVVRLPGRRAARAARGELRGEARNHDRDRRVDRRRQDHPREPAAETVRRDRRVRARGRRGRSGTRRGPAVESHRHRAAATVPVRRHRRIQPPLRQAGRDR